MMVRTARCACGALQAACGGEPARVSICHCLDCQRRTGSAFSFNARFDRQQVSPSGPSQTYSRTGDSGKSITFHFCPSCGSTVYWMLKAFPDVIAVAAGAFAGMPFPAPWVSVYEDRSHDWLAMPETITDHHS